MDFATEFYNAGDKFLENLLASVDAAGVRSQDSWYIDHLCFRTSSINSYHHHCAQVKSIGTLLTESEVNGRPIATFKLNKPFLYGKHWINVVEVPAPKGSEHLVDGFEHVEIVVDKPLHEIQALLKKLGISTSDSGKVFNNELKLKLSGGNLKFHLMSLESVVRFELSPAFVPLMDSMVLEILNEFEPVITGTFPLGIYTKNSDIDLLLTMADKNHLLQTLKKHFSHYDQFQMSETVVDREETVICQFSYDHIPFEIFAQKNPSTQQTGFRHFQIEERLLQVGGERLARKVFEAREQGLKTEPAFAKVLGLPGDPYQELLKLQTKTLKELSALTI